MFQTDFRSLEINDRIKPRFEPYNMNAIINLSNDTSVEGKVLDVSRSGIAVSIPLDVEQPRNGSIELELHDLQKNQKIGLDGGGEIVRRWSSSRFGGKHKGFAIKFNQPIDDNEHRYDEYCFNGVRQRARIAHQANIAGVDMDYLGQYRQKLIDCQLRLFILCLTIGVTLAGAYFGLSYHSSIKGQPVSEGMNFWRTMIAGLPALLAFSAAFMSIQKSITIQRIDAFLSILKERMISFKYPKEYKGWENGIRKLRYVINTKRCESCCRNHNCGQLTEEEKRLLKNKGLFWKPAIDLYNIVVYLTFVVVFAVSLGTVIGELLNKQLGISSYMAITFILSGAVFIIGAYFFKTFWSLRKGKHSFEQFRRNWLDTLNNCSNSI